MHSKLRLVVILIVLLLGSRCRVNRPNPAAEAPLAALGSTSASARFGVAYWAEQAHERTSVWGKAVTLCAGRLDARLPNCSTVRLVARWEDPPDPPPLPEFRLPPGLERELDRLRRQDGER